MWKMRGWEVEMSHPKHLSDGDSVRLDTRNSQFNFGNPQRKATLGLGLALYCQVWQFILLSCLF